MPVRIFGVYQIFQSYCSGNSSTRGPHERYSIRTVVNIYKYYTDIPATLPTSVGLIPIIIIITNT